MLGFVLVVLIRRKDGAQISEVPVKLRLVLLGAVGNGWHNYVAAVPRIARDGKVPGVFLGRSRRPDQKNKDKRDYQQRAPRRLRFSWALHVLIIVLRR